MKNWIWLGVGLLMLSNSKTDNERAIGTVVTSVGLNRVLQATDPAEDD